MDSFHKFILFIGILFVGSIVFLIFLGENNRVVPVSLPKASFENVIDNCSVFFKEKSVSVESDKKSVAMQNISITSTADIDFDPAQCCFFVRVDFNDSGNVDLNDFLRLQRKYKYGYCVGSGS